MYEGTDYIRLVEQAQHGDRDSMDRLAEMARRRLGEHVYRITLQANLTQDIVQESMLEMFKLLGKLKHADRFWPWLYGIAFNKIRHHNRSKGRQKTVSISSVDYEQPVGESQDGLAKVISEELKQIVVSSMGKLKPRHRAILSMRCYEELEYSEIAELMSCSEFAARMLFYRARKSLARQLSRQGLGKGSLLLALTVFGKLTATSEAAITAMSVSAGAVKVGLPVAMVGLVLSKTTLLTLTAAGIVAVGSSSFLHKDNNSQTIETQRSETIANTAVSFVDSRNDVEECWYYFPDDPAGSVMTKLVDSDRKGQNSYCQWLQNEAANYYYDEKRQTVYIKNHRMWNPDFRVRQLPTDSDEFTEFIGEVQGSLEAIEHTSVGGPGLLIVAQHDHLGDNGQWRIIRHYNVLEEDYFQSDWPAGAKIVDERDKMHKQGWSYFVIDGNLNGREVSGIGQVPFVYRTRRWFQPWLKMKVDKYGTVIDTPEGACLLDTEGNSVLSLPAGSFFKGLGRPWMGLHTIDTVRRDAAEQRLHFETTVSKDYVSSQVKVSTERCDIVYTIDMDRDVIEKIVFSEGEILGELTFFYSDDISAYVELESLKPYTSGEKLSQSEGMMWLNRLAREDMIK